MGVQEPQQRRSILPAGGRARVTGAAGRRQGRGAAAAGARCAGYGPWQAQVSPHPLMHSCLWLPLMHMEKSGVTAGKYPVVLLEVRMPVQAAEAGRAVRAWPACTQAPHESSIAVFLALSALRGVTVQQLCKQGTDDIRACVMMCAALLATMSTDAALYSTVVTSEMLEV